MLTNEETVFISEHASDDTSKLLFAAKRFDGIDVPHCAVVIEARKKVKDKIPMWFENIKLDYPSSLSIEQCSSQSTAIYKQQFVESGYKVADLTGGLGVDSFFLSQKAQSLLYIEKNITLFNTVRENFSILGCSNIQYLNSDCRDIIDNIESDSYDLLFIDPARRDNSSNRVYSIVECEPNLISMKDKLFRISDRILAKVSPMADISHTLAVLPECKEVHIVAVDNECKELLLYLEKGFKGMPKAIASNIHHDRCDSFPFFQNEERECKSSIISADSCQSLFDLSEDRSFFIYQPNKAILKSGAFKLVAKRYNINKLSISSHLYVSNSRIDGFPGREFAIRDVVHFNKDGISYLKKQYPIAELLSVNFPLDTNTLRKKLGIRPGGERFLLATTIASGEKVIFVS